MPSRRWPTSAPPCTCHWLQSISRSPCRVRRSCTGVASTAGWQAGRGDPAVARDAGTAPVSRGHRVPPRPASAWSYPVPPRWSAATGRRRDAGGGSWPGAAPANAGQGWTGVDDQLIRLAVLIEPADAAGQLPQQGLGGSSRSMPASVRVTLRPCRKNNGCCSEASRPRICWLMADWVRCSSSAALWNYPGGRRPRNHAARSAVANASAFQISKTVQLVAESIVCAYRYASAA